MASSQSHIDQWKHNRAFLATIAPAYPDWLVTVAFYVALHAVDALLAHDKVSGVTSHDGRNRTLMNTNRYAQIWKHYQTLYDLSRTVRYLAAPAKWIPADQVDAQVLRRNLYPIERSVEKLMGQTLPGGPVVFQNPGT
jgi:hypothetical protein